MDVNSRDVSCGHKASTQQRSARLSLTCSETSLILSSAADHRDLQASSYAHMHTPSGIVLRTHIHTFRHRPTYTCIHLQALSYTHTCTYTFSMHLQGSSYIHIYAPSGIILHTHCHTHIPSSIVLCTHTHTYTTIVRSLHRTTCVGWGAS